MKRTHLKLLCTFGIIVAFLGFAPAIHAASIDIVTTATSFASGATSDYTFTYTTQTEVVASNYILYVNFPYVEESPFVIPATATVTVNGVSKTPDNYITSQDRMILVSLSETVSVGSNVVVVLSGVTNSSVEGNYNFTMLQSSTGGGGAIDEASDKSFAIVPDTTDPTATLSPVDDATGVAVNADLIMTFDEVVDAEVGGTITIKNDSDDSTVETFTIPSERVTGTGTNTITINPTANLDLETSYYVQVDATAFDDTSENSYAGITDDTTWSFTTAGPFIVNSTGNGDDGTCNEANCTLREAISLASALDEQHTITFQEGLTGTITLNGCSGEDTFVIQDRILIDIIGPGSDDISISGIGTDCGATRLFDIRSGGS